MPLRQNEIQGKRDENTANPPGGVKGEALEN